MELQCDVCFVNFDLGIHRPKSLPCGHTICHECVENPALQRKCPTCRKGIGRNTNNLPDNIIVMQMIEQNGAPPRKKSKKEDSAVQQLQRGVDAGRKVVEQLRQVVPLAVEALNRQLDSSVAQLRQVEEALEQQVVREAAGGERVPPPDLTEQLQLAAQLELNLRMLTTKCSVVAEEEAGAAWRALVQLDVVRVLLLQLQADGHLEKVDDVAVPATSAAFVGPPLIFTLNIKDNDLSGGHLKVNDIIRDRKRWRHARCVRGLKGEGSDLLLRVLAPELRELQIKDDVTVTLKVMGEVQKMVSLKRLDIRCNKDVNDYPALPLQLEELRLYNPNETQLRCVGQMPGLRSLTVRKYLGPNLHFTPSPHGTLQYLCVGMDTEHKATMLSLIRSHASSLQELRIVCTVSEEGDGHKWYFPDLGQDLVASSLLALRRLILSRLHECPCTDQVAVCFLQRQALRSVLPSSVDVFCYTCNIAEI